jgi:hypothetical protein
LSDRETSAFSSCFFSSSILVDLDPRCRNHEDGDDDNGYADVLPRQGDPKASLELGEPEEGEQPGWSIGKRWNGGRGGMLVV